MAAYQQQAAAWGGAQQQQAASQWTAAQQQQWQQQQAAWGQQQAAAQQQGGQQAQQGWQQQNGANAAWQQQQYQQQQSQQAGNSKDVTLVVTGCSHATVGGIVRGTFQLAGENHGKPTYKKDGQVNGLDVMTYYWDERDGAGFCGWWFGPKVGGDQVWAYHSDKAAMMPPQTGWKVPYDGPVDPTFVISMKPKGGQQAGQQQAAGQQQGWGQQQQQQQGWGQQGQQQWTPEQNAQYQAQMAKKMEEQKKLQQQQQQLQQLKQQQQQQMQQQQLAEQKRKLEENRKRLEEMNKQRQAEQQKQAALMKQKQEEAMKKRQEELEKQRVEQTHVLAIRKVLTKLRAATTVTFEACKAELDEALAKELEGCGSQKERVMTESEQAIVQTKERMEQLAAEMEKRKEAKAKALEQIGLLQQEMEKAEEKAKGVAEELEPLKGDKDMTVSEIEAAVSAVEEAAKEANAQAQVCAEFIQKEAAGIKAVPQIEGEEPHTLAKDFHALTAKLVEVKKQIQEAQSSCKVENTKRIKKAHAKEKLGVLEKTFKKYAKSGEMTKKDLQAYAQGEFKFKIPAEMVDSICNVLIPDGAKGIPVASSHRMVAMVGIAREGALDAKRRAAREAKEKEIAAKKEKLQATIAAATELSKTASEKVIALEAETADAKVGPKAIKDKSSADLATIADGLESSMTEAKDSVKAATDAIAALSSEVEPELKAFLMSEVKKLESSTKPLDGRINKASANCTKVRAEATKKNAQELDKLRKEALEVISHFQGQKDQTNEEIFSEFAGKSDKITEKAFLKFFSTNKMEGEKAIELSEESLKRLFSHLVGETDHITKEDFISMVKKFMKVVKASALSDGKSIKSNILRRLEEGEVVEVITGPSCEEGSDVKRMRVKALQDNQEGWLTPVGNAGTVFLVEGGNTFKVVKETILTGAFVIGEASNQKDRKLKIGEVVEVREWAKKEETAGLMRMKVCVKSDGQIGWATSVGNTGIKFLEQL